MLTALRYSAFNVVSIATTTGFANTDYALWPIFAPLWMLLPVQFRHQRWIDRRRHQDDPRHPPLQTGLARTGACHAPERCLPGAHRRRPVPVNILFAVLAFGFVYVVCIVLMTLLLSFTGLDIVTAFPAVVASINNTGPGLGRGRPGDDLRGRSTISRPGSAPSR